MCFRAATAARSALPLLVELDGTAEEFGDEPLVIAREAEVPVYVAAERYEAGLLAEAAEPASRRSHLLDDGFQHRQLHRDVDILLLSCRDLGDHLLPAGNLREALHAAERANVFAIPEDEPEVAEWVKARGWKGHGVARAAAHGRAADRWAGGCVLRNRAGRSSFLRGWNRAGLHVAARFAFPDHHSYTAGDLERVTSAAQKAGAAAVLTTEKDRARLGAMAESFLRRFRSDRSELRIEIEDEAGAIDWLMRTIGDTAERSFNGVWFVSAGTWTQAIEIDPQPALGDAKIASQK